MRLYIDTLYQGIYVHIKKVRNKRKSRKKKGERERGSFIYIKDSQGERERESKRELSKIKWEEGE